MSTNDKRPTRCEECRSESTTLETMTVNVNARGRLSPTGERITDLLLCLDCRRVYAEARAKPNYLKTGGAGRPGKIRQRKPLDGQQELF